MTQLKVGDRVRRISNNNGPYMLVGDTGVVRSVEGHRVRVVNDRDRSEKMNLAFYLEKIEEPGQAAAKGAPMFKVGDRVVTDKLDTTKSLRGEIIQIYDGGLTVLVRFDSFNRGHGVDGREWWMSSDDVVLISAATLTDAAIQSPTAIVALITNGVPKPSVTPRAHASEQDAKDEAQRLANKHRKQQFGVFVLSSTVKNDKPIYEHNWQTLASDGMTIDAIKELRRITGLGLRTTKEAVENWLANEAA